MPFFLPVPDRLRTCLCGKVVAAASSSPASPQHTVVGIPVCLVNHLSDLPKVCNLWQRPSALNGDRLKLLRTHNSPITSIACCMSPLSHNHCSSNFVLACWTNVQFCGFFPLTVTRIAFTQQPPTFLVKQRVRFLAVLPPNAACISDLDIRVFDENVDRLLSLACHDYAVIAGTA